MSHKHYGEIITIDSFLPESLFFDVKSSVLGEDVDWKFLQNATNKKDQIKNDEYFVHKVFINQNGEIAASPQYNVIRPVLYFIDDKVRFRINHILRINCTLVTQRSKNNVTPYHVDSDSPHHVGILYLNTCNGPTMIQDKKVDCIENRFVFFDGRYEHAAVQQTDTYSRVNVVFNLAGNFY